MSANQEFDLGWIVLQEREIKSQIKEARRKMRSSFVGEYDGMKILEENLPLVDAYKAGKDSELYKATNTIYKVVKDYLRVVDFEANIDDAITGRVKKLPSLTEYDGDISSVY